VHLHPADQAYHHSPADKPLAASWRPKNQAKRIATAKQKHSANLGPANASQLLISDSDHNGLARHKHHQST
jgi:hypothetical protein